MPKSPQQRPLWVDELLDLAAQEATGRLLIASPRGERSWMWLRDGELTGVSAPMRRPLLARRLVAFQAVSAKKVAKELESIRLKAGARLLDVLLEDRLVPARFVDDFVRETMAEQMAFLLDSGIDSVTFDPGRSQRVSPILLTVQDVVARAVIVPYRIPDDLAARPLRAKATEFPGARPIEQSFLAAADGHRLPAEVGDECGLTTGETLALIEHLRKSGLLSLGRAGSIEPEPESELSLGLADTLAEPEPDSAGRTTKRRADRGSARREPQRPAPAAAPVAQPTPRLQPEAHPHLEPPRMPAAAPRLPYWSAPAPTGAAQPLVDPSSMPPPKLLPPMPVPTQPAYEFRQEPPVRETPASGRVAPSVVTDEPASPSRQPAQQPMRRMQPTPTAQPVDEVRAQTTPTSQPAQPPELSRMADQLAGSLPTGAEEETPPDAAPEHTVAAPGASAQTRRDAMSMLQELGGAAPIAAQPGQEAPAAPTTATPDPDDGDDPSAMLWPARLVRPTDPMASGDVMKELKSLGEPDNPLEQAAPERPQAKSSQERGKSRWRRFGR